jgi:hypothetical protein
MENCINIYNQFLDEVQSLTKIKTSAYKDNIEDRLNRFYQSLQNSDTFSLFSMTKIKVFSAKTEETYDVSSSLFGEELTLKHIFNNQTEEVKFKLWELLLNMYIQLERVKNNNQERIASLKDGLKKLRQASSQHIKNDIFKNVLNTDVNNTTSSMIDDIIGSFQNVVSNKGNPFENIMGITEMITSKYGSKIENGEVEIDKILGGMGGLLNKGLSGMGDKKEEEPVVMDENFSTADVDVGQPEEEKKENAFNFAKLMPLANMVNKIGSIKTEDDIKALKQDMDQFMEKELKVDMSEYKENLDKLEKQLEEAKLKGKVVEPVNEPAYNPEDLD